MPEAEPPAATEPTPAPKKLSKRRQRVARRPPWLRWTIRVSIVLLVVILATAGSEFGYLEYVNHQITRVHVKGLSKSPTSGPHVGEQTFLLIGSTSRCVLNNKQTGSFGSCAAGITGVNSDVIILLRADQATHTVSILSIPRDLAMNGVRPGQFYKIDAALADGPSQLVAAIEQNFGIPINHFVELNFDTFQNIVNALGGIKMYFPYRVSDDSSGLHIRTTGCVYLNGFNALAVVRARNYSYYKNGQWIEDGTGDLGRIIRVHEFLRVLATAVSKRGLGNPITDNSLLEAVAPNLEIDSTLSTSDMVNLLRVFHGMNPDSVPQLTMPNIENFADYMYEGYDFGSVVLPTYPQDQQAIDQFEGVKLPPASHVAPGSVTVSVENGSGIAGVATETAAKLALDGFKVLGTSTTASVGPISETVAYYKPGHVLDAERVLENLHGIVAMAQATTDTAADVTVVTGSDFTVVVTHGSSKAKGSTTSTTTTSTTSPAATTSTVPASTTTSTVPASTTTSTTTTTLPPSQDTLGSPSSANQALPSYDPRACPGT